MLLVVPAIIAWLLASRWPKYGFAIFTSVYLFFGILFFTARYIDTRLDFPQAVVDKQQAFLQIAGRSIYHSDQGTETSFISFLKNTPQAITLSFLRPYPGDVHHLLSLAASLGNKPAAAIILAVFIFQKKEWSPVKKR